MRTLNLVLVTLSVLFGCITTSSLVAQSTMLDGFNKKTPQKSPQRQLAQRIAPSEKQQTKNQLLPTKQAAPKADEKAKTQKPTPQPISKQRRAELMSFVKANHPELQPLLNQLQSKREKQFETALRSLDRNVKHLQALEKKSPQRYQRALKLWGVTSRIQLLTAQLAIKKSDKERTSIRKKIRPLLEQQSELQKQQILINLEAAKKKHEKILEQLKNHEATRDSEIARKLKEIDKTSERVKVQHKRAAEKKNLEKTKNVKTESSQKAGAANKKPPTEKTKPVVKPKKENTKVQK